MVGTQEWIRPDGLGAAASREHYNTVADRLMDEAVAIADREDRAVAVLTPAGAATVERRGFAQLGEAWWRSRPRGPAMTSSEGDAKQ